MRFLIFLVFVSVLKNLKNENPNENKDENRIWVGLSSNSQEFIKQIKTILLNEKYYHLEGVFFVTKIHERAYKIINNEGETFENIQILLHEGEFCHNFKVAFCFQHGLCSFLFILEIFLNF